MGVKQEAVGPSAYLLSHKKQKLPLTGAPNKNLSTHPMAASRTRHLPRLDTLQFCFVKG